jgi:nucleotide-binding universal stress UspA family protein
MAETCPINNLEKMMLTTDGSEFSEGAVREALSLAGSCGSELLAISIVEANDEFAADAPDVVEKEEKQAGEVLAAVKSRADEAGVKCETAVHTGDGTYRIIVDEAKKTKAEMIVMGRRGRTGLARVAMGSVTARVVGHAPCDVLVVPRDCSLEFNKILVATDGSSHGVASAEDAIKMAKKTGGSIIALSVASSDSKLDAAQKNVDQVKQMAEEEGIGCEAVTSVGKHYAGIVAKADEIKADLIVVGCHGKGGLGKLLMGSVTERVIGHASCSVLVAACA